MISYVLFTVLMHILHTTTTPAPQNVTGANAQCPYLWESSQSSKVELQLVPLSQRGGQGKQITLYKAVLLSEWVENTFSLPCEWGNGEGLNLKGLFQLK